MTISNIFSRTKGPYSAKPCSQHRCVSGRIATGFWSVLLLQKAPGTSSFSKTAHFVVMRMVSINIARPINERFYIVLAKVKIVHHVMSKLLRYVSWLPWVAMRIRNLWRCGSPKRKKYEQYGPWTSLYKKLGEWNMSYNCQLYRCKGNYFGLRSVEVTVLFEPS